VHGIHTVSSTVGNSAQVSYCQLKFVKFAVIAAAVASLMPAVVPASVAAAIVTVAVSCSVTLQRDEKT
jgi:hypothetical protein